MVQKKNKNYNITKSKLENFLMLDGKKSISEKLLLNSIILIQKEHTKNYKSIVFSSLLNNMPVLHLKTLRKKKKKMIFNHIPYFLEDSTVRIRISIKSLVESTKTRTSYKKLFEALKTTFIDLAVFKNTKDLNHLKKEIHEVAYIKKNFSHYRWF